MVLESVDLRPVFIPIEHLNRVVVRAGQHVGKGRVHNNVSDVVSVLVDSLDLFGGIVVVDAEFGVIGAYNNPLFARDELSTTDRRIGDLDGPDL